MQAPYTAQKATDRMRLASFVGILLLLAACLLVHAVNNSDSLNSNFPVIVITWDYKDATEKGISSCLVASIYQEIASGNLKTLLIVI